MAEAEAVAGAGDAARAALSRAAAELSAGARTRGAWAAGPARTGCAGRTNEFQSAVRFAGLARCDGYSLEIVAVVPSILVKLTVNFSLYVSALS